MFTQTVAVKVVGVGATDTSTFIEMLFIQVPFGKARSFKRAIKNHVDRMSGWRYECAESGFGVVVSSPGDAEEIRPFVSWVVERALDDFNGIIGFGSARSRH